MRKTGLVIWMCVFALLLTACGSTNGSGGTENAGHSRVDSKELTLDFAFGTRTGMYTGSVNESGTPDGQGIFESTSDAGEAWTYEGTWVDGHWNGYGKSVWDSGQIYEGQFSDDTEKGHGMLTLPDGNIFIGDFDGIETATGVYYTGSPAEIKNGDIKLSNQTVTFTIETETNPDADDEQSVDISQDDLLSQIEVEEITMTSKFNKTYYILIATNNSTETLRITANTIARDSSGSIVGASSPDEVAVGHGESVPLISYFDGIGTDWTYEYTINAKIDSHFEAAFQDLAITEESQLEKKVILTVTNNGSNAVDYAQAQVLFFNADALVGYTYSYFTVDNNKLESGQSVTKELSCGQPFDDIRVFLHGRRG